tara:strand:- start:551 stop:679 length:129 start_codon:yes stop_codon:yes gene_type:complete
MIIWERILDFVAGFILVRPFRAIIGILLGNIFDKIKELRGVI